MGFVGYAIAAAVPVVLLSLLPFAAVRWLLVTLLGGQRAEPTRRRSGGSEA